MPLHVLGLLAALWQVEQRIFDGPDRGGVRADLVPDGISLPHAALLAGAYAAAVWALYRRRRVA